MQPWGPPDGVNQLQNQFLQVLNDLGIDLAERFFRDQMRWGDYHRMVLGVFWRYPRIVLIAWQVLGAAGIQHWIDDYLRYTREAILAASGRWLGVRGRLALVHILYKLRPALSLRLRARFAEWQSMGWL
jgi:lycopene cyclase CruA